MNQNQAQTRRNETMAKQFQVGDKVYKPTDKGWIELIDGNAVTIVWDQGGSTVEQAAEISHWTLGHFYLGN